MIGMGKDYGGPSEEKAWFYIQWHFIERCNLRCKHCYQEGYSCADPAETELMATAQALNQAMATWKRTGRISLTGGEPFFAPEYLFKLLDFFSDSPYYQWIGILTNGTLIDAPAAAALQEYSKLREVQVSLDGATAAVHDANRGFGTFTRALAGLEHLIGHQIPTAVMFTLTANNKNEAVDMIDLCLALGVQALTIERISPIGHASDNKLDLDPAEVKDVFEKVAERKRQLGSQPQLKIRTSRPLWCLVDPNYGGFCPAGLMSLCVMHDGTLLPCRRMEIPLGNILREGIFKTWYTSPILWNLRQKNRLNAGCRDCTFLGKCGGCRAVAFAQSGDYLAMDAHCWKGATPHE